MKRRRLRRAGVTSEARRPRETGGSRRLHWMLIIGIGLLALIMIATTITPPS
jgi:hypothetical protein